MKPLLSSSRSGTSAETLTVASIDTVPREVARAGQVLRDARRRRNLTLEEVAEKTGLDASSISRFERGRDGRRLSRKSLELLADAARVEGRARLELFRPLGLPPTIERDLAAPELAGAFYGLQLPEATYAALRQCHLAGVAANYASMPAPRGPVDPGALLRAHRIQVHEAPGQRPWVRIAVDVWFDAAGTRHRRRFLVAHAAAHHALAQDDEPEALGCSLPGVDELEMSANALAWLLLLPPDRLRERVLSAGEVAAWEGDGGIRRIADVAEHFDVPLLAAAKRMAEEGLIAELWGLNEP